MGNKTPTGPQPEGINGKYHDHGQRDLIEALEKRNSFKRTLKIQVMTDEQVGKLSTINNIIGTLE